MIATTTNQKEKDMTITTIPRFPDVEVQLVGNDGNAFAILGAVKRALRDGGARPGEVDAYFAEATSGDYDHLLQTTMRWVNVC